MKLLRRLDVGVARGEAAIAAFVLLMLILVAAAQALLRNLTALELQWANDALEQIRWADSFMQKATLWLAFFGASLATHDNKHIAIDVLSRIAPPRLESLMRGAVGVGAGVICFYLARVFLLSVLNNGQDIPFEYQVMDDQGGSTHICEATAAAVANSGLERPGVICAFRGMLASVGAPVATPDHMLQLIVPAMFLLISIRFLFKGAGSLLSFVGVLPPDEEDVTITSEHDLPKDVKKAIDEAEAAKAKSASTEEEG